MRSKKIYKSYNSGINELTKLLLELHSQKDAIAEILIRDKVIHDVTVIDALDDKLHELLDLMREPKEFD